MARRKQFSYREEELKALHEYGIYPPTRTILLGSVNNDAEGNEGHVDASFTHRFYANMLFLMDEPPRDGATDDSIRIILNTYGGDVYYGQGIYDFIRDCPLRVVIDVYGVTASMGAIIIQAADHRRMSKNSRMMIHHAKAEQLVPHGRSQVIELEDLKQFHKWQETLMYDVMSKKDPSITRKEVHNMHLVDTWLSADKCLEYGLVDEIIYPKHLQTP